MPPLPGYKSVPIDTGEYRRQVNSAFRHAGETSGTLGRVVQDCVEGLGACLESKRGDKALRK